MGFTRELNWILKLKKEELPTANNFRRGEIFGFTKQGDREYPLENNIFLVDENWNALAYGYVRDYHNYSGYVSGNYIIEEFLSDEESKVLSPLLRKMYSKD